MWTKIKNTSKSLQIQGTFKKLEYSADKFASSSKHKHSNSKKNEKKPDRSMEIDNRSKDYFEIRRSDRKNTLSGHKRKIIDFFFIYIKTTIYGSSYINWTINDIISKD